MSARNLLDLAWLIPALPAFGAVVLLLFGKKIGEPKAGWFGTAMIALSFVASLIAFFALRSLDPDVRANVTQGFHLDSGRKLPCRFPLPRRPAVVDDDPLRHGYRHADPPLRDRIHARRRALLALLRVSEPVRGLDARARHGLQLPHDLHGLGRRGPVFVPPHLVLVRARLRSSGRQEGLHHEPRRRLRLHAGDVPHLPEARDAQLRSARHERPRPEGHRRVAGVDRDRDRIAVVPRRDGQERAAAAAHLVARRHGRSDPGVGPDPRRHDGDRGCLPPRTRARVLRGVVERGHDRGVGRCDHRALRGDRRARPERHQARARVFHDQSARLHVLGRRCRCVQRGDVPHDHPRVLQGAPVPRRRFGDPRR